ncbi:DUF3592 domain-containing protein [Luteimicrobium subarcticum]|uniref:Uncharacterized protein DUF3592 n=1 Tax=Luteimicrobium subarcticum TaxID=620910 RepID=A0A2M8WW72_9MICO|nr:DUF3592 domain-containing protein [Luteimicrobium subarcticum]PJI95163.1 uncharacterized protein DUF3592 [Luteimicrobium subarcticum]
MKILFAVIPAVIALFLLWSIVGAVREISGIRSLERSGQRTPGRVVASHSQTTTSGTGDDRRVSTRLVETIEFPTVDGRRIRGVPTWSDVGMLDRSDQDVQVSYDPERPDRFIAPKGARMGTGSAVTRIVVCVLFLVFVAIFFRVAQGMLSDPLFGGSPFDSSSF